MNLRKLLGLCEHNWVGGWKNWSDYWGPRNSYVMTCTKCGETKIKELD